jgi:hypothetical protein
MLRINLLPPYIYEGSKRRNVYVLWVVLLLAAVGGLIYWKVQLSNEAERIAQATRDLEPTAKKADDTQTKATNLIASNAALKAKADFVRNSNTHDRETYQNVLGGINNYTITRVLYSSVVPAGQTVQLAAYAPSLSDVGHYMMAMEKNPQVVNVSIAMNSIPSFPLQEAPAARQQIGFQGFGGGGGGGGPAAGQMTGPTSMMASGQGALRGRRGGDAGAGAGGAQQVAQGNRPPGGGGHDFTVTLALKNPIPPAPSYGGGGGGVGGGGGGIPGGTAGMVPGGGKMGGGSGAGMGGGSGAGMGGKGGGMASD